MAKKKPAADEAAPSFEESLAQLEQLVARLEDGKLGLGEALKAYEQGVARLHRCYRVLEEVERRHVQQVLASSGTLEEAAARLGIDPTTLWRKRKRWGLD